MGLVGVLESTFEFLWPQAEPYLQQAIERGPAQLRLEDFEELCRGRDMQLWVLWDLQGHEVCGAGVTEILNYPTHRAIRVVLFSGAGISAWRPWWDDFADWARHVGATRVESFSRVGMKKLLAPLGWRHQYDVLVKEL